MSTSENVEFPNVMVYSDDFVYDHSSGKCVDSQRQEEESRNCWEIPVGKGHVVRYKFNIINECRQYGDYDANLVKIN